MRLFFLSLLLTASLYGVPIKELHPGQHRYASPLVVEKIEKIKNRDADQLPVVKYHSGYLLIDGHHHVLAALALDRLSIPIEEIADYSHLSDEQFWSLAEEKGWIYLHDLNGKKHLPPADFELLQDDPNRYFAALTARKYSEDLKSSRGAEYPLWLKVGKDIPFIEFLIADALYAKDFVYSKDEDLDLQIEKARTILLEAHLPGLRLIPERKHHPEIMVEQW